MTAFKLNSLVELLSESHPPKQTPTSSIHCLGKWYRISQDSTRSTCSWVGRGTGAGEWQNLWWKHNEIYIEFKKTGDVHGNKMEIILPKRGNNTTFSSYCRIILLTIMRCDYSHQRVQSSDTFLYFFLFLYSCENNDVIKHRTQHFALHTNLQGCLWEKAKPWNGSLHNINIWRLWISSDKCTTDLNNTQQ